MTFSSLGLSAELLRAVREQGYHTPTPIQAQAIPAILAGSDLMASAQTGTGKTAAFTLPLLQRLMASADGSRRRVRALVLAPTRELTAQVGDSVRRYGRHLPVRCAEVFGGVSIQPQIEALRKGVDIVVATPGRLIDHLTRRTADLSAVDLLVLDEGDRMLDMGFLPAIERVLRELAAPRQTLLFSATFADPIRKLARGLLKTPEVIDVARRNAPSEGVAQSAYLVDAARKRELLAHLIGSQEWRQVLVFTRTKHGADRLAKQLTQDGIDATAIHGNKSQGQRTRALAAFKRQSVRALVATDVAARGLDIDQLPHVVNFDLPHNPEDYVHRIGRTGRAGQKGSATSLVCAEEHGQLAAIKRLVESDISTTVMAGFEPVHGSSQAPQASRRGGPGDRQRQPAGLRRGRGGEGIRKAGGWHGSGAARKSPRAAPKAVARSRAMGPVE
jgi:ATP-dependent RNA helicase RhlE